MATLKSTAITIICVAAYLTTHAHEAIRRGHDTPGGEIMFLLMIPALVYFVQERRTGK